ncbi:unnamed protein product [marine sediment metagenome]|uniref:Uncharacterized protein n=1 Tax=marine sediment metagenome TaxID=412755 RepID=X0U5R0_9ZZZZ
MERKIDEQTYEIIKEQQYRIHALKEYLEDVTPWQTCVEEIEDEVCISIGDFEKWRERLLKILGGVK